jgi:hypothetical protein
MIFRTLALAVALSLGLTSGTALAAKKTSKAKVYKPKTFKPKKDKRFKDSKVSQVKPRKAPKRPAGH